MLDILKTVQINPINYTAGESISFASYYVEINEFQRIAYDSLNATQGTFFLNRYMPIGKTQEDRAKLE